MLEWIGSGGKATEKRIPPMVFVSPTDLLESFLEGLVDGDGTTEEARTSVWTTSEGLVADLLVLFAASGVERDELARPRPRSDLPGVHADA